MSLNAQKQKVASMQQKRKEMGKNLDWDNQSAVQSFNSFQASLKKEEAALASMQKDAQQGDWDFDGGWDD